MKLSFVVYIALISAFITSPSTQCNGLMRKLNSESQLSLTCRKTRDFGFCAYTLRTDPRSAHTNVNGLAQIALDQLSAQAKVTSRYLQGLRGRVVGKEAQVVGRCIQLYRAMALKDVSEAITSFNGKANGAAKHKANIAMKFARKCQQGVDHNPSPKWQMISAMNKLTEDLSRLSSDLIRLLG
ncbi:pectinesterase inhibitor-like [Silene latifolia]|uniref:pectinesterase inhibitor-like n=1 Tax=Silene latifolia TaxID=37657 RepID=UPI003D78093B